MSNFTDRPAGYEKTYQGQMEIAKVIDEIGRTWRIVSYHYADFNVYYPKIGKEVCGPGFEFASEAYKFAELGGFDLDV